MIAAGTKKCGSELPPVFNLDGITLGTPGNSGFIVEFLFVGMEKKARGVPRAF